MHSPSAELSATAAGTPQCIADTTSMAAAKLPILFIKLIKIPLSAFDNKLIIL